MPVDVDEGAPWVYALRATIGPLSGRLELREDGGVTVWARGFPPSIDPGEYPVPALERDRYGFPQGSWRIGLLWLTPHEKKQLDDARSLHCSTT